MTCTFERPPLESAQTEISARGCVGVLLYALVRHEIKKRKSSLNELSSETGFYNSGEFAGKQHRFSFLPRRPFSSFAGALCVLKFHSQGTFQHSLRHDRSSFTSTVMENQALIQQRRSKCPKACILAK